MKKIVLLFSFIFLTNCFAIEKNIVILTSIKNPTHLPLWKSKRYKISDDIETQFRKALDNSNYNLIFNHDTTPEALSYYLTSPSTYALFWVSHAANEVENNGLNFAANVQDVSGNNVKNIFQKVSPYLRFLALVGCNGSYILDNFKKQGLYSPDLVTYSFNKKISLNKGIRMSIQAAENIFENSITELKFDHNEMALVAEDEPKLNAEELNFSIINTNPGYSAILTVNEQYIGLLQKGNETQTFKIPQKSFSDKIKIKVSYNSEIENHLQDELEALSISASDLWEIKYLKDKNGRPYGKDTHFYTLFKSNSL